MSDSVRDDAALRQEIMAMAIGDRLALIGCSEASGIHFQCGKDGMFSMFGGCEPTPESAEALKVLVEEKTK